MKDREIACKYYVCEGECKKGRAGTFRKQCQTCNLWDPVKGGRPARINTREKKKQDILKKDLKDF